MSLPRARTRRLRSVVLLLAIGASVLALGGAAATASTRHAPELRLISDRAGSYSGVVATAAHRSLYVLSTEKGGHLHCKGACIAAWPPVLLSSGSRATKGAGVRGKIGTVVRAKNVRQLTYNGYPLYTFSGDPKTHGSAGQNISSFGGTWTLVRASATTPSATPFKAARTKTTSKRRSPTTTSGYSYSY